MRRNNQVKLDRNAAAIMSHLRRNSRLALMEISRIEGIPETTLFDRLKSLEKTIIKYCALPDFRKLGFPIRLYLVLSAKSRAFSEDEKSLLLGKKGINNVYVDASGSIIADLIMQDMAEADSLLAELRLDENICLDAHFILEELEIEKFCP
ncbi:Lrp/AsnC family transcriptional regulator [Candidatus Woesearchaeota archaeon]|nr:Lrp/AsnC family transcriptional regulator [Candidatus Woesearchaeota archaeon]